MALYKSVIINIITSGHLMTHLPRAVHPTRKSGGARIATQQGLGAGANDFGTSLGPRNDAKKYFAHLRAGKCGRYS